MIKCIFTKFLCDHFQGEKTDVFLMEYIWDLALMAENGQFAMMHPKDRKKVILGVLATDLAV